MTSTRSGEGGDEHALVLLRPLADLLHQVVHLVLGGPDLDGRVQQAGGPDDLLDHEAFGLLQLVVGGRGAHVYGLTGDGLKLVEGERTVVRRRGQAESVFHERRLAGMVAAEHRADLRQGDMALVDEADKVVREIVDQGERALARLAAVEIAGIILHARAVAHLLDHLDIVLHPLLEALRLEGFADALEILDLGDKVVLDLENSLGALLLGGDEVLRRVQVDLIQLLEPGARHGIHQRNAVHLVAEELDPGGIVGAAQENINGIAPDTEGTAFELGLRPVIEGVHNLIQETGHRQGLPFVDRDCLVMEIVRIADAVQAGDGRDDDDVPAPRHQGGSSAHTEFVDLVVDAQVLFNVRVCRRNIGLRLIVVVVGNEVLHRIVREERLELAVQLRSQRLVVAQDQGWALETLDDIGHREGLP